MLRLDESALMLAKRLQYPDLDIEYYISLLDNFANQFMDRLDALNVRDKEHVIDTLNYYLFEEQGFRSNSIDYYNPSNNYLNDVIENRAGIPITLSIIYMEIGRRAGFVIEGINFPGHFIVRYEDLLIDPYNKGRLLARTDLYQLLYQIYEDRIGFDESFLQPIDDKHIIARLLRNLTHSYIDSYDYDKALTASNLLLSIDNDAEAFRDRGLVLYYKGDYTNALQDLLKYLEMEPEAHDMPDIMQIIIDMSDDL